MPIYLPSQKLRSGYSNLVSTSIVFAAFKIFSQNNLIRNRIFTSMYLYPCLIRRNRPSSKPSSRRLQHVRNTEQFTSFWTKNIRQNEGAADQSTDMADDMLSCNY